MVKQQAFSGLVSKRSTTREASGVREGAVSRVAAAADPRPVAQ